MIDDRRWHIYKDATTPGKPWHVERVTREGLHCPSPNEPAYAQHADACEFVAKHVAGFWRRHPDLAEARKARATTLV